MSHHISGPRAEAEPIADITDLYAFPSPEHPGRLVLVLNTLPFTPLSAAFSDGLIYRFRLRPLTANTRQDAAPFAAGGEEIVLDCVFSAPATGLGADAPEQEGTCVTPAGETVSIRVNDEHGGQTHGVRVFAGPRWDPFIMDAPTTLKTIATGKLAFTDPGAIYLDGKNVLSLVVEVDRAVLPGGADLFGVVAETLTRGSINVRLERAGRPEVPNLMLAPTQFDPVNRDLEIRDLYNMDDAFHLSHVYASTYRARLNANLKFWDGLDGKTDWPGSRGRRTPANRAHPGGLPRRGRHQAVRRAGFVPGDRARSPARGTSPDLRWPGAQRRCDGHDLHAARERGERARHPRWRRSGDEARVARVPLPGAPESRSAGGSPSWVATEPSRSPL